MIGPTRGVHHGRCCTPRFYPVFALALALVVFAGFARTYYLRTWFDVPPITLLVHLHSLVFSCGWRCT